MKPAISIIIPVYNEAQTIAACLTSLQNQSLKSEIIVIDDGSTDATVEITKKFPVELLTQKHLGPGAARNLGTQKAKGEILVFVDADMTFDTDFIKNLTAPVAAGKTKGVFNTKEIVSNYGNLWARCWNINQDLKNHLRFNPDNKEESEDFRAILKSEFLRVGGFDLTGYTDSRTLVKKLGVRPTPVDDAVSYHANPDNLTEIFYQARWIGRRPAKLGLIGRFINLIRSSLPFSLLKGISKAITYQEPGFVVFKIVYDFGFFVGVVTGIFGAKNK